MTLKTQHPIWHPCSQMKDYETFAPLEVAAAKGPYLYLKNGKKVIDAIASWWCKSLGHHHPRLKAALLQQIELMEHVILANTVNDTILSLSHKLATLHPSLNKVFYASDGSSAIEIAMKMSLHARKIKGQCQKKHFVALENSFHGETVGALSMSDVGIYRKDCEGLLFSPYFIGSLPYVSGVEDPLWQDCTPHWLTIEKSLEPLQDTTTALMIEPIVQGTSGMKIYSQDFLKKLKQWCLAHDVHLIADEIMTGLGRTGKMLAIDHAGITADFVCLGKGLTGGWLPLSAMLTSQSIYDLFYEDYSLGKSFLHSHTHSGNVLAASVALEVLTIFEEENILAKVESLRHEMFEAMLEIADDTKMLQNIRGIGGIVAADLIVDDPSRRFGYEVYQKAVERGALLRPLGNTIYWLPPLNISKDVLNDLKNITRDALLSV